MLTSLTSAIPSAIMIDLPLPPSVNQLWRWNRKGVRPSERYRDWKKAADGLAMVQRAHRLGAIPGRFEATILCAERANRDLDNMSKAVLDWAQSRRFIVNDKLCRKLTLEWVEPKRAPDGCRLILTMRSS